MKYFIFGLVLFLFGCTSLLDNEAPKFSAGQCVYKVDEFGVYSLETAILQVGKKNYQTLMYDSSKEWISGTLRSEPIWLINQYTLTTCPDFFKDY